MSQDSLILSFFDGQLSKREEKLWLHLDKPYYAAGDTIWFRAYLGNAATLRPDTLSNFIYVDLFDRRNKLISSKKIKRDSIGFANNLCLSDTLAAGEYTLQAYTGWMLNFDPSCFFQKNILIGRTASDIRTDVTYTDKDMIVRFSDKSGSPLSGNEASYELFDRSGKRLSSGQQPTSPSGALFIALPNDSTPNGAYAETRLKLGNGTVYKRTFFPEPQTASFDIQFLPEGGHLVPGAPQIVAFKAVQPDGYPAKVNGTILNPIGDTVARFSSEHDGMGTFLLTPQLGETYRAISFCDTLSISASLPVVRDSVCAMTVTQSGNNLRYRILGTVPEGSMLVAHLRGICQFIHPITPGNPQGLMKTDSLPEGILHLLLVDSSGQPCTERLVYLSRPEEQWQVTLDKSTYGKREKVRIGVALGKDGLPLEGNFSVSVTDANTVKTDSLAENIRTNLLLTSDLKGYIHNPGYYFLDDSPARRHYLDLVMLTHGWKRFDTKNLFQTKPFNPKYYFEHGQYISGHVKKLFGRDAADATVTALGINRESVIGSATADSTGHFTIDGLDFQDTTIFLVSSKNKRGKIPFDIDFDALYPRPMFRPLYPFLSEKKQQSRNEDLQHYLSSFPQATDDGLAEYELEGVTVTAKDPNRPVVAIHKEVYDDTARFAKFNTTSLEQYVKSLPTAKFSDGELSLRSPNGPYIPAQIRVNNEIVYNIGYLNLFTMADVEYINAATPSMMSMSPSFPQNATKWEDYPCRLEIFLKETARGARNFSIYKAIGYSENAEFYHPIYDTPEKFADKKPDLRTTLYWNPYQQTGPEGDAIFEFYSGDSENSEYEITIEGITSDGSIIHCQSKLQYIPLRNLKTNASPQSKGSTSVYSGLPGDSRIRSFFDTQLAKHEEKLWLHLDKPYYAAGDTVWFRAHLVDAVTHIPNTLSNFVYVDLFDRTNKSVLSKKIKRDSLGFANNLCLPDTLAAGEYTLQAYTGWMLNFNPSCFFQKNISIGRTASSIRTDITYTNKDMMIIRFSDRAGSPLSGNDASYELFDRNGKPLSSGQQPTSPSGALFIALPTDSTLNGAYAETRLKLRNGTVYKRTFFPEPQTASFDIQFLPEGGHLVPGTEQIIAFKAVRSDGYPAEVNGAILNPAGDTVARFSSEHDGMGTFLLTTQQGENYRAVSLCDTLSMSTLLPTVQDSTCALTVTQRGNNLRYRILGTVPEGSMLVAHTRGVCQFIRPVTQDTPEGPIETAPLPEGILHLLLLDSEGQPYSERLVYLSRPGEQWQATSEKRAYGKREKVRIDIAVEKDGQPLEGNFSVSVTDANTVKTDSLSGNIRTDLLLTSDLKGYIHNPGYYFLDDSPARRHDLDLVMLTHGWRRFDTKNLFRPEPFTPKHYIEHGQYISGQVKTLGNRDAKNATVTAIALNQQNDIRSVVSDSTGRFLIEGLDFQDSTVFFLSSKNKRGKIPFEVRYDKLYSQPKFNSFLPFLPEEQQESQSQYLQRYLKSFHSTDDKGMWEIDLEEVTVKAKNPDRNAIPSYTEIHDDTARFAKFGSMSLEQYLVHLPNVKCANPYMTFITPRGRTIRAQIRVDNTILSSTNYLHQFTVSELKSIRFIIPRGSIPSFQANGINWPDYPCRIEISLREDVNGTRDFVIYRTNGYAKHVEFYAPVYDTPEKLADKKPDNRSTLYWNPYLQTGPDGKASVEFYSSDSDNPKYEITIEGVILDGIPCRYQQKL